MILFFRANLLMSTGNMTPESLPNTDKHKHCCPQVTYDEQM